MFWLVPPLSDILCRNRASLKQCKDVLWQYVLINDLLDKQNRAFFWPDSSLAKIFGSGKIHSFHMTKYLLEQFSLQHVSNWLIYF
ncbi:MAG: SWIB/MDM2 domain-containing protein [Bacteroidia bacterium]